MLSFDKKFLKYLDQCASFLSSKGPFLEKPVLSKKEEALLTLFQKILKDYRNDSRKDRLSRHFKRIRSFNLGAFRKYFNKNCQKHKSSCWVINFIFKYTLNDLSLVDSALVQELYKKAYSRSEKQREPRSKRLLNSRSSFGKFFKRSQGRGNSNNKFRSISLSVLFHLTIIVVLALTILDQFKDSPKEIKVNFIEVNKSKVIEESPPDVQAPEIEDLKDVVTLIENKNIDLSDAVDSIIDTELDAEKSLINTLDDTVISKINFSLSINRSFVGRGHKGKQSLLTRYGGSKAGQNALLKGLRYLKKIQNPDGSWNLKNTESMTAFAILAFLAYGATDKHREFGGTVRKGLSWMLKLEAQNMNKQISGSGYQHPIFTFAICEASAMMPQNTQVKQAMNRLVLTMLNGQCPNGGFPYYYRERKSALTLTGWNGLALKAALDADCQIAGINEARYKLIDYLKTNFSEFNNFHYPDSSRSTNLAHKAIGTSLMQYFEGRNAREVKVTLNSMKRINVYNFYEMYYTNICMFNEGGELWPKWASGFQKRLILLQSRDGAWRKASWGRREGWYMRDVNWTMSTSLACLMLTVFYRYPPAEDKASTQKVEMEEEGLDLVIP